MTNSEQVTRHEREIGELRGKLDALATKEFVRNVVQEQTTELNAKFDAIDERLKEISERQQRFKGSVKRFLLVFPFWLARLRSWRFF